MHRNIIVFVKIDTAVDGIKEIPKQMFKMSKKFELFLSITGGCLLIPISLRLVAIALGRNPDSTCRSWSKPVHIVVRKPEKNISLPRLEKRITTS